MGRGVTRDVKNIFGPEQEFQQGISCPKRGVRRSVEQPTRTADSQISLITDDMGKIFTDKNITAGKTVSIPMPLPKDMEGRFVTIVTERATKTTHPKNVTAVVPKDKAYNILGQTAKKGLYATAAGASITLGSTGDAYYIAETNGTWTEEP